MSELSRTSALASRHTELGTVCDDALVGGEILKLDGNQVGVINSPCYSHRLNKSLALVHLSDAARQPGTRLDVVSDDFTGTAVVDAIPFLDPSKSRTHS
jgi:aminomethyltransferase